MTDYLSGGVSNALLRAASMRISLLSLAEQELASHWRLCIFFCQTLETAAAHGAVLAAATALRPAGWLGRASAVVVT